MQKDWANRYLWFRALGSRSDGPDRLGTDSNLGRRKKIGRLGWFSRVGAESWAARLGRAELGQAEACAGRTGRPSGVASWAQERSLGCLRLGRPGGESGLGPVAEFWAGLVWVGFGFWVPFLFHFFFLSSQLKTIWIQMNLNSNSYTNKQNKTMHQHECNNKI